VITFVIAASGLKYVGVGTTALGWILCATLLLAAVVWLAYVRPRQRQAAAEAAQEPLVLGDGVLGDGAVDGERPGTATIPIE
jgi:cbb3-type cytochrome oxidase subunit 3